MKLIEDLKAAACNQLLYFLRGYQDEIPKDPPKKQRKKLNALFLDCVFFLVLYYKKSPEKEM